MNHFHRSASSLVLALILSRPAFAAMVGPVSSAASRAAITPAAAASWSAGFNRFFESPNPSLSMISTQLIAMHEASLMDPGSAALRPLYANLQARAAIVLRPLPAGADAKTIQARAVVLQALALPVLNDELGDFAAPVAAAAEAARSGLEAGRRRRIESQMASIADRLFVAPPSAAREFDRELDESRPVSAAMRPGDRRFLFLRPNAAARVRHEMRLRRWDDIAVETALDPRLQDPKYAALRARLLAPTDGAPDESVRFTRSVATLPEQKSLTEADLHRLTVAKGEDERVRRELPEVLGYLRRLPAERYEALREAYRVYSSQSFLDELKTVVLTRAANRAFKNRWALGGGTVGAEPRLGLWDFNGRTLAKGFVPKAAVEKELIRLIGELGMPARKIGYGWGPSNISPNRKFAATASRAAPVDPRSREMPHGSDTHLWQYLAHLIAHSRPETLFETVASQLAAIGDAEIYKGTALEDGIFGNNKRSVSLWRMLFDEMGSGFGSATGVSVAVDRATGRR